MKLADVVVGSMVLTRIGGELARVKVVQRQQRPARPASPGYRGRAPLTQFLLQREGETRVLQKLRTAAALRPLPAALKERVFVLKRDSESFQAARVRAAIALGYPTGSDDPAVFLAAARIVAVDVALKRGHLATADFNGIECGLCDASGSLDPATLQVRGSIFTIRCKGKP